MKGNLRMTTDLKPLKKLQKKSPVYFKEAAKIGAIQFLTWCNTGTGKSPKKPPIRFGVLRGSSSAFVGGQLVLIFKQSIKSGAEESATPATSYTAKDLVLTWVWNTDYAKKMHEWGKEKNQGWGKFTLQDRNAGNKWLEDHIIQDRKDLLALIRKDFFKKAGLN